MRSLEGKTMGDKKQQRGFTLIAALLLTILLSGIAVGLLFTVSNESRMGGNELEGNLAFYGAEAGMENLTAQLSTLYQTSQTPTAASITALASPANYPTTISGSNITSMNYVETITWPTSDGAGNPTGSWDIVGSGQDQGMVATLIPFNLSVTAIRQAGSGQTAAYSTSAATGATANLNRTVEVALLPAFEFGVFCDGDCDYFAGPNFNFGGRVHTNGNLYLASGANLTFTDKIAAVGQVITDRLENGWGTGNGYTGQVWVPSAGNGCPAAPATGPGSGGNCIQLTSGSWSGGIPPSPPATSCNGCGGSAATNWKGISTGTFNSFIVNGLTGATKLQLPFVESSKVGAIDIIRRPAPSDSTLLSNARLYNKAQIRILLADTIQDLHPERGSGVLDANDVQILLPSAGGYQKLAATAGGGAGKYMYYATATNGTNGWVTPTVSGCSSPWPLLGEVTASTPCKGAWLRVEYENSAGNWVGVTQEWLGFGFGRGYNAPPTAPYGTVANVCPSYPTLPAGQCYNPISPAILILQQLQQGVVTSSAYESDTSNTSNTAGNWIPINFYDAREGEPRDNGTARAINTTTSSTTPVYTPCSAVGVMNTVELDMGNLWLWLQGKAPYASGSGLLVNNTTNNGYILYFSDHRGMLPDTNPMAGVTFYNNISGMSGLNDTVNSSSTTGAPDGILEPATYYAYSPEDVAEKEDGILDNWGEKYLGAGFGLSSSYMTKPYFPIPANATTSNANQVSCATDKASTLTVYTQAQNNMVTGPRHALRLIDGGMDSSGNSYLPHPISPATYGNGFTVGSEEPVYVWGDYNSGPTDPSFPTGAGPHSAAAIIADAVTLLSDPPAGSNLPVADTGWTDVESFLSPGDTSNRPGNTSYYRVAIAAGKSVPFPEPSWASSLGMKDFGTDGGMHNFLRYLENRGANNASVNYVGSIISMYYSQYATGVFKCCDMVYGAPTRNYYFDTQFLNPNNLPPGTPMFQDVVSLSYHQTFTPQ